MQARSLTGRVVFTRSGRWWAAELPSFPGAHGQGRTQLAAYRNLLAAMRDLVEAYQAEAKAARRVASR